MPRLLFISALPQCGDYSRAATIRGEVFIRGNTVYIIIYKIIYIYINYIIIKIKIVK